MNHKTIPSLYSNIKSDIKGYRQKPVHNKRIQLYYLNKYGNVKTILGEQMNVNSRVYLQLKASIKNDLSIAAVNITKEEWNQHAQNIEILLASSGISFYLN